MKFLSRLQLDRHAVFWSQVMATGHMGVHESLIFSCMCGMLEFRLNEDNCQIQNRLAAVHNLIILVDRSIYREHTFHTEGGIIVDFILIVRCEQSEGILDFNLFIFRKSGLRSYGHNQMGQVIDQT